MYFITSFPLLLINKFLIFSSALISVSNLVASSIFDVYSITGLFVISEVSSIVTVPTAFVAQPLESFVTLSPVAFTLKYCFLSDELNTNSTPGNTLLSTLSSIFLIFNSPTCGSFTIFTGVVSDGFTSLFVGEAIFV